MASSKLLKEAIADAKAVRETALANAKIQLEEAFTPRLKSMLSQKLRAEAEDKEADDETKEDADKMDEDLDSSNIGAGNGGTNSGQNNKKPSEHNAGAEDELGAADVTTTSSTTSTTTGNVVTDTTTTVTTTPPRDEQSSTEPTAPQKADSAPTAKLTVRQGIVAAMNNYQQELVKSEQITIADTYSVEFVTDAIAQAKIKKVGQDDKASPPPTGGSAKEQLDSTTQSLDKTTRLLSITAGMPMVQVIDQLLKNLRE